MNLYNLFFKNDEDSGAKKSSEIIPEEDSEFLTLEQTNLQSQFKSRIEKNHHLIINSLLINENEYFKAGEPLLNVSNPINYFEEKLVSVNFNGKVDKIFIKEKSRIYLNNHAFKVHKIQDERKINKEIEKQYSLNFSKTEIGLIQDEFTDETTIKFTKIAGEDSEHFKIYKHDSQYSFPFLGISFVNHQGNTYLSFLSTAKEFSLASGDSIILLFENKERLHLTFNSPGTGSSEYRSNYLPLTEEYLEFFLNKKLIKLKLISKRRNIYDIYDLNHQVLIGNSMLNKVQYKTAEEGQFLLNYMTKLFIKINLENNI